MKTTILFGGTSRERLVSVASAQALTTALPQADLWFWDLDGTVHITSQERLLGHEKPFEVPFKADGATLGTVAEALDTAAAEDRVLVLGLHGGTAENGQFQVLAEARGVPFTGSGSAASHLAFDKTAAKLFAGLAGVHSPSSVTLDEADEALAHYGRLIAKPAQEGSSYGLIYVNSSQDIAAVKRESASMAYLIEPFITGPEATCGVLEQADGSVIALPPVEIVPGDGAFDYAGKYLKSTTQEICPARFDPAINAELQRLAVKAHKAMSCRGYSRSDFIVSDKGPIYLETNTLPGLTKASLYPKSLKAQGIEFIDFLHGQIDLAIRKVVK
ncbi:D-alanine--D-alanine ligase family protein [Asticcacaulis taihuensis]|uniref:D-alanine-D-alanine ligase n=1 Tax=Asticcacaulis taihuensis TaxID=260084 RepID=A0A1G4QQF7_9CAUL|nr:ATP-grasp domain-containing protein [Asticcacaulis taihuensis]SCW46863.1 D-alanine-D-alanine ligase [Asticcacaulis taihuensis]